MAVAVRFQPKKRRNPAWVFVPMGAAFAILAAIAIFGIVSPYTLKKAPPPPGRHGALVWGDGIFSNSAQLKAWLRLHGASYQKFVKAHPAALRLVKPRPVHAVATRHKAHKPVAVRHSVTVKPKPKPKPAVTPAVHTTAAPSITRSLETVAATQPSGGSTNVLFAVVFWLAVLSALALGAVALGPQRLLARFGSISPAREREVRMAAFGAGTALLLGVVIATLLA